jgi:hypothetical protein
VKGNSPRGEFVTRMVDVFTNFLRERALTIKKVAESEEWKRYVQALP